MKREIFSLACGLWLCAAGGAMGQQGQNLQSGVQAEGNPEVQAGAQPLAVSVPGPVVVELYTSQGCSSCPPADALLAELAEQPDVIPLALHVDYWDYIGWEDVFANPGFTKRQKAYAKVAGERMIYTPQMIVAGTDRVVGHEPEAVALSIARAMAVPSPVRLTVSRRADKVVIRAEAHPPLDAPAIVQLVGYDPGTTVEITHGENAGQVVEYRNIVTSWVPLGEWSGREPVEMTAPMGKGPGVVIVQRKGPAEILAAARVD